MSSVRRSEVLQGVLLFPVRDNSSVPEHLCRGFTTSAAKKSIPQDFKLKIVSVHSILNSQFKLLLHSITGLCIDLKVSSCRVNLKMRVLLLLKMPSQARFQV